MKNTLTSQLRQTFFVIFLLKTFFSSFSAFLQLLNKFYFKQYLFMIIITKIRSINTLLTNLYINVYQLSYNELKKRQWFLSQTELSSEQSFMLILNNLQLEINHLQNYVKKYTVLWHFFKYWRHNILCSIKGQKQLTWFTFKSKPRQLFLSFYLYLYIILTWQHIVLWRQYLKTCTVSPVK